MNESPTPDRPQTAPPPKSRKKRLRTVLILVLMIPVILLLLVMSIGVLMIHRYNETSYLPIKPVEREDTYVIPAYPEDLIVGSEEPPYDPEDTGEPDPPVTAPDPPVSEPDPPETLPSTLTPPATSETRAPDTDASFANSDNAVSVYTKIPIYKVPKKNPDIVNILVLGTDSLDVTVERGRSDTMLIVSYNKKTGAIKMISLLRDLLIPIEGHDWNRINTAYSFGGVGLAVNTLNQLFGLDIQEFVVIDLNGAADFIDYVGGVDLAITEAEAELYSAYTGREFTAGTVHMDSFDAMMHLRNRSSDNDFGRTRRQRDVIVALMNRILKDKSLPEIYETIHYALGLVKTNIPITELLSLAASVVSHASALSVESHHVPFESGWEFAWYKKMAIISFDIGDAAGRIGTILYQ